MQVELEVVGDSGWLLIHYFSCYTRCETVVIDRHIGAARRNINSGSPFLEPVAGNIDVAVTGEKANGYAVGVYHRLRLIIIETVVTDEDIPALAERQGAALRMTPVGIMVKRLRSCKHHFRGV
jgi:hypothetical protein